MRNSNGASGVTGRTGRRMLSVAVAGGAAAFVLAGGGIAMASPLPGHGAAHSMVALLSWNHVSNLPGTPDAGRARGGQSHKPTPGAGGQGSAGGQGGIGGQGGQGGQGGDAGALGG
jgi:hypothetical protein